MPQIRSFIQNLPRDCPGLIIDLRDNPGGTGLMAPGLLGMLVEENKPCGRLILRSGELNFNAYAQSHAYLGEGGRLGKCTQRIYRVSFSLLLSRTTSAE